MPHTNTMKKQVNWAEVKKNEVVNCFKCRSYKTYTNSLRTCFECKKRFCGKCINGGQINAKMLKGDEIRKICDQCVVRHKYRPLGG